MGTGAQSTGSNNDGPQSAPHRWMLATTLEVTERDVKLALLRGSHPVSVRTRLDVLEAYCGGCRRPYEDVADEPCSAVINNEHLRGGPIGERRKRKGPQHTCSPTCVHAEQTRAFVG